MGSQHLCLKWNKHYSSLLEVSSHLLNNESLVDVTLSCEGLSLKAHKLVLSACSPYFQSIFVENPCQHPVVIMKGVGFAELRAIVDFMYHGQIRVTRDQLATLLETAQMLQIRGLADESEGERQVIPETNSYKSESSNQTVPSTMLQQENDTAPRRKKRRKRHSTGSSESSGSETEQEGSSKVEEAKSPVVINIDEKESEMATSREMDSIPKTPLPAAEQSTNPNKPLPQESHVPTSMHEPAHTTVAPPHDNEIQNVEVKVEPTDLIEDSMDVEEDCQHHRHHHHHPHHHHHHQESQPQRTPSHSDRLPHLPPSFSVTPVPPGQENLPTRPPSEVARGGGVNQSKNMCLPSRTVTQPHPSRMMPDHLPRSVPESLSILPVSEPLPTTSRGMPDSYCGSRTTTSDMCTRTSTNLTTLHVPEYHPSRPMHQQHPLRPPSDVHPSRNVPEHFSQRMMPDQLHGRTMAEQYHARQTQDHHFRSVQQQEGDTSSLVPFSVSSESSAGSMQDSSSQDVMMINSVPFDEASGSTNTGQSYQHEGNEGGNSGSYMMYGESSGVSAMPGPSGHHLDEHNQSQHGNSSGSFMRKRGRPRLDGIPRRHDFVCHLCKKSFTNKDNLNDHMILHTPDKEKHRCDICNKEFRWRTNVYTHKKMVHNQPPRPDSASNQPPMEAPATPASHGPQREPSELSFPWLAGLFAHLESNSPSAHYLENRPNKDK